MLSTLLALALLQPTTQPGVNTANLAIDGDVSEWPVDTSFFHATNTDQLFVKLQGYGMRSLTGGAETLVLLLDVDGDKRTGADLTAEGGTVGIDLRVDFNMQWRTPLVRDGETIRDRRRGSKVTGFQADGTPVDVHQWDIGLISGPTYAAGNFEARIQTEVTGHSAAVFTLPDVGEVRGVVMIQERGGPADRPSRTLRRARLTGMDSGVLPERDTPAIPEMTDDVIRVASWNLLYDKPIENPTPFAEVITTVDADVWLLQEWTRADRISQPQVEAWFAEHVGDGWHIETSHGQGVVIASRFPISATGPDAVDADPNDNSPHPVRFAAAVLDAPSGPMTVATVHLKCCGSYQSSEDKKRWKEITAAAAEITKLHEAGPLILGGDFNLVGSPHILEPTLPKRMVVTKPAVLSDPMAFYTWGNPDEDFGRSRLDYMLHSDDLEETNAFVINPAAHGIENVSDHLPIVVDVK